VNDILSYRQWLNLPIYNEFYRPQILHHELSRRFLLSDLWFIFSTSQKFPEGERRPREKNIN
jgi:hypothetical protein